MEERVKTWLGHIVTAIEEVEGFFMPGERIFEKFCSDTIVRRAVEREIEIIGEAMNRILKVNPNLSITHSRQIVATRNYIAHGYDSLSDDMLWNIVINHLAPLKQEVEKLLKENETL